MPKREDRSRPSKARIWLLDLAKVAPNFFWTYNAHHHIIGLRQSGRGRGHIFSPLSAVCLDVKGHHLGPEDYRQAGMLLGLNQAEAWTIFLACTDPANSNDLIRRDIEIAVGLYQVETAEATG